MITLHIWLFFETRFQPSLAHCSWFCISEPQLSQISFKYTEPTKGATAQGWLQEAASSHSSGISCLSWTASTALAEPSCPSPRHSKHSHLSQLETEVLDAACQVRLAQALGCSHSSPETNSLAFITKAMAAARAAAQADQPRVICKERSSFNRKWNTHLFHDRTGHTRVF